MDVDDAMSDVTDSELAGCDRYEKAPRRAPVHKALMGILQTGLQGFRRKKTHAVNDGVKDIPDELERRIDHVQNAEPLRWDNLLSASWSHALKQAQALETDNIIQKLPKKTYSWHSCRYALEFTPSRKVQLDGIHYDFCNVLNIGNESKDKI